MSSQSFKKKTRVVLTNMDLKFIQSENKIHKNHHVEFLNSSNNCKACGHDCSFDIETKREVPLEKHHVSYFPERIAYVHVECHFAIHHRGLRPDLIEYADGDSRRFYDIQKNSKSKLGGCSA